MPNWCNNTMTITPNKDTKDFKKFLCTIGHNYKFEFGQTHPIPHELKCVVCSNTDYYYVNDNGDVVEAPPYPTAKLYFLVEDQFEDSDWISELVRITAEELPAPKPRKTKGVGVKSDDIPHNFYRFIC